MSTKRIIVGALLSGGFALAGLGLSMGTAHAFDPQPDPQVETASSPRLNPGVIRGFNPPPGAASRCGARHPTRLNPEHWRWVTLASLSMEPV
jgi:hypothetical protein